MIHQLDNSTYLDISPLTIFNTLNDVEMEKLGYMLPKPKPTVYSVSPDDPRDIKWLKDWYAKYLDKHQGKEHTIHFNIS